MPADPLLLQAGQWLGVASAVLAVLTIAAFLQRWGLRFRLVGITSFTVLLALSCAAFAISYSPRVSIPGAVVLPVVYDNGAELVVAAAPEDLPEAAILPSLEQISRNLRGSGRKTADGLVHVRVRQIRSTGTGRSEPVVLAEATRNLADGSVQLPERPGALPATNG
ncbi:MAG: Ycf51 family protein [Cyanobacteriota bacterium]